MDRKRDADDGLPTGRVVFDERGNAVWEPVVEARSPEELQRTLKTERLSLKVEGAKPATAEDGYDPYRSGPVHHDGPARKKKDLRALSEWIKLKKRLGPGG
jgi:hypothetical protein